MLLDVGQSMKRPTSVTFLGVLVFIQGLIFTVLSSLALLLFSTRLSELLPPDIASELAAVRLQDLLLAASALVMGGVSLVSSIGILQLRSWAWLMAMIAQGINLFAEMVNYTRGQANYISLVVSTIIVFSLNQRDVQMAFRVAHRREDPASVRTAEEDQAAIEEARRDVVEGK